MAEAIKYNYPSALPVKVHGSGIPASRLEILGLYLCFPCDWSALPGNLGRFSSFLPLLVFLLFLFPDALRTGGNTVIIA